MGSFDQEKHLKPLIAGCLALLLFAAGWLYTSHQARLSQLDRKIIAANQELNELGATLQEYRQLESQLQRIKPKDASNEAGNLISAVENATEQVGARSQLVYVRPQPDKTRDDLIEEGVEIKLEKLKLHQLVELLYQFDQSTQVLKIAQLRMRTRFDNPEQLDTSIILSRFKEKR